MSRSPARLRRYAPHFLVATTAIVIFLVASDLFPYHSANHDEGVYLQQAAMLLDGGLVLQPPVEDAFRPWFFVEDADTLYPKYAPVTAAIFAIPLALGVPRLALAIIGAMIVATTYAITAHVFDRRTGLIAGALLLTSPLFVLDTATFLPYAPTTALNLVFAYAYLRAEAASLHQQRWAALAGGAIGLAFFSRPYTALLFATPFIAHACWSLWQEDAERAVSRLQVRRTSTALLGLLGVAITLAYNWRLTGDPLVFPYQAFAPHDGLGFGHRELLDHSLQYTPELSLRVNARVLRAFLTEWGPLGVLGSLLAAYGASRVRRNWDWQRAVLLGVVPAVVLGNVYFWGNYNILGNVDAAGDGLIAILGPYYHFDLLLPTAVFAAHGLVTLSTWVRTAVDTGIRRWDSSTRAATGPGRPVVRPAVFVVLLVVAAVLGSVATVGAFDDPVDRNAGVTAEYEAAYQPFIDADGPPQDAVVFLPATYGPWLNHPFQLLRNPPDYRSGTVYALPENEFAVVDAYPERPYYRYAYRGTWNPFDGASVTPTLQRVHTVSGREIQADIGLELPAGAASTSIRLATDDGYAYYAGAADNPRQRLVLHVNETHAWVTGTGLRSTGASAVTVEDETEITLVANVNTAGSGFAYRVVLPVSKTSDGTRRVLTPALETCTVPQFCGGGAAYIPGPRGSTLSMNVSLHAA